VESEARGNASRFDQILAQYNNAPDVTRQRLYLDAQETILSSVSKIVVDQKAGNSLLYLPLDKLLSATSGNTAQTVPPVAVAPSVAAEAAIENDRSREAFRSRERESR
jgi:modulator of FtsH protease HflK